MSCTKVSIFKRLIFLICQLLILPLVIIAFLSILITGPFLVLKWLFTGCADEEVMFKPVEIVVNLPYKIIE
jgi:hypothetical protein